MTKTADPKPYLASTAELVFIGYTHASVIGIHRPDIAYPDRKIKPGKASIGRINTKPCDCADEHVEVWVRRIEP